ncbi:MAG: UvrB/UvrC motif-containing protein [Gemmatimonas sp.]|jgi:protein arginine kinase activator|uniref:UvrB/UvrC motif-containing protein n=1 Tax=Gemmatimonas sp. TaxID=1962908 RepID=UPI00391F5631|nr:UvrB/UvrC motif-containing protein [Gemmatimonadota bacterium]
MLCDHCNERDAVVHLTRIVDNAVTQLHLCEKCAAAKGVETTLAVPQHPLGDILQAVQQQAASTGVDAAACSFCGATARDFRASGRLGCPHCYDAMEQSLRELLRRLHGSSRHVGQRYDPPATHLVEKPDTLHDLRDRLRRAVDAEQFELAAELRDRIRVLE